MNPTHSRRAGRARNRGALAALFAAATLAIGFRGSPTARAQASAPLRPPAVPLVACDPYFSIWSPADQLTEADTVHWTGKPQRLTGLLRLDGKMYRFMGREPADLPALPQTSLRVLPTQTIYTFQAGGVELTLTFMTPALPDELMVYSRPVTYLTFETRALDHEDHHASAMVLASPEIAVNEPSQVVTWSLSDVGPLAVARAGTTSQVVLGKKGDDLRIDWGYFLVAAPKVTAPLNAGADSKRSVLSDISLADTSRLSTDARTGFFHDYRAPATNLPASQAPTPVVVLDLGMAGGAAASRWCMLAYDDEFSIQYFGKNLRPWWRRNGDDAAALLAKSAAEYESLKNRCEQFDACLMEDLARVGGERYAEIGALAYRQCVAANKVVAGTDGRPLMFPKENFSNGCIGTVDVIYPMAPQFLLFSPALAQAMLAPILDYAMSARWRFPFAPHDLGTYPLANGQVYGGGERTEADQMPVEETANLLILLDALAKVEGNPGFCDPYWPMLIKWADYLKDNGIDPKNQLCTDDFAGHLAHNVNLSAKAICGLAAFSQLCQQHGDEARANRFSVLARAAAIKWIRDSADDDHSRLAFDKPGTWSQKYNLVWDRILGLELFPDSVREREMDFYKTKQNIFGLPLDNRADYTKLDWTLWTATLTQQRPDFAALLDPVYRWLNRTPSRVPMTDWFDTRTGKQVGFQARSVVGGVFLEMLYHPEQWKLWASGRRLQAGHSEQR